SACPTCPAPSGLSAEILSLTQAELSWSSSGNNFDIEWGTQGFTLGTGTSVTGFTATSTILSGLTGNTYYQFYVRQNCGVDGYSSWAGPYTFYTSYCEALTQWTSFWESIQSFSTTGGINNIFNNSGDNSYPNGYGDYTSMSVSHFEEGEVSFSLYTNGWVGVNIWV